MGGVAPGAPIAPTVTEFLWGQVAAVCRTFSLSRWTETPEGRGWARSLMSLWTTLVCVPAGREALAGDGAAGSWARLPSQPGLYADPLGLA